MPETPTCPFSRGSGSCAYCSHMPVCPLTRGVRCVTDAALLRALEGVATLKRDEPLSRHTTIGIGGPSEAYVVVSDAAQLRNDPPRLRSANAPTFILGSGSNIVVGDRGIPRRSNRQQSPGDV